MLETEEVSRLSYAVDSSLLTLTTVLRPKAFDNPRGDLLLIVLDSNRLVNLIPEWLHYDGERRGRTELARSRLTAGLH